LDPIGTSATDWPTLPAPRDYEDGKFGGMMICRGNRSTRRKLAPVPLRPPQIPHDLTGGEPGTPRLGSQRLTARAMARPIYTQRTDVTKHPQ
jgi:hypothetical protein